MIERGGPWVTLTFTSEDHAFVQSRVLSLAEAEEVIEMLSSEIVAAKNKYNIREGEE